MGVNKSVKLSNEEFKIGEVVNKKYVLLIKNKQGIGTLYYYALNIDKLKRLEMPEVVSFIISQNCMALLNLEYDESKKIFICACENKILLLNLKFNGNKIIIENNFSYYIPLKNCSINCLYIIKNINENSIFKNDSKNDSYYLITSINKKSEFRIYNIEHVDKCVYSHDSDVIQKEFIKAKINGEIFKNKVGCISQSSNSEIFVICPCLDSNSQCESLVSKRQENNSNNSTKSDTPLNDS